jgi:hypothetical protein
MYTKKIDLKQKLWDRTNGLCFWCGKKTLHPSSPIHNNPMYPTLDHVIPKAAGGTLASGNIVVACKSCNSIRGLYNVTVFSARERDHLKKIDELKDIIIQLTVDNLPKSKIPWWSRFLEWIQCSGKRKYVTVTKPAPSGIPTD